jgi:hypothetical protein
LALVLHTGQNPANLEAAHSCHNRRCVNPSHLRWATRSENSRDRRKDGTSNSKITLDDATYIRLSTDSVRSVAERFGISTSAVYKKKNGMLWK